MITVETKVDVGDTAYTLYNRSALRVTVVGIQVKEFMRSATSEDRTGQSVTYRCAVSRLDQEYIKEPHIWLKTDELWASEGGLIDHVRSCIKYDEASDWQHEVQEGASVETQDR